MLKLRILAGCGLTAGLVLAGAGAWAQEAPQMVGVWKATAYAVHIGSNPYRVAETDGVNLPANAVELTYTITRQEGNRFTGTSTNGKFNEVLIGAISPDNRSGVMLDNDGQYAFTLRDPNTLDACYTHSFPTSRVAGCWQIRRAGN